jgi:hypothetical protein
MVALSEIIQSLIDLEGTGLRLDVFIRGAVSGGSPPQVSRSLQHIPQGVVRH